MRIALFTDIFLTHPNGVATSIVNLAVQLGQQGHVVLIVGPRSRGGRAEKKFSAKNVRVLSLLSYPVLVYPGMRVSMPSLTRVARELRRFKPDVAHIHTPLGVGLSGLRECKKLDIPIVGTNHLYLTKDNASFFRLISSYYVIQKMFSVVTLQYFRMFYGSCTIVTAPSLGIVDALRSLKLSRPVVHLPNALSIARHVRLTPKSTLTMKKKWGLRRQVILHFGRISHEKNVEIVIRSFALVHAKNRDVSLLIIGDGPAKKKLEALARSLHIRDAVVFTGMIEHAKLMRSGIVGLADLFVTASTMENQPMVLLEAMSFGLPVIAADAAGLPELVDGNGILTKAGSVTAMTSAMSKILKDSALRRKMSARSYRIAESYDPKSVAAKALQFYKKAVSLQRSEIAEGPAALFWKVMKWM